MRSIILSLIAISLSQICLGQFTFNNQPFKLENPPQGAYQIIQKKKGQISRIEEYNENGVLIFKYELGDIPPFFNWKEPQVFIYAYEFDESGRLAKQYSLNSNAGHRLYEYEFDGGGSVKTTFTRLHPNEGKINSNAYASIARIKSFNQLKKASEVTKMSASSKAFSGSETLNGEGKPIKVTEYNKMYRDSTYTVIQYDKDMNELSKKTTTSKGELVKEVVYEKKDQYSTVMTISNYRNGKKMRSYQSATYIKPGEEVGYSERRGKLNIRHSIYKNRRLASITNYNAAYKNKLIIPVSKKLKKASEMKYSYNKLGLMEKEEMNDFRSGKSDVRTYTYEIIAL